MSSNFSPLAETFKVSDAYPQGCHITSVDLFFAYASPSETYPVEVRLVETLNGYPTQTMLSRASSVVSASTIINAVSPVAINTLILTATSKISTLNIELQNAYASLANANSRSSSFFGFFTFFRPPNTAAIGNLIQSITMEISAQTSYIATLKKSQEVPHAYKVNFKFSTLIHLKPATEYAIVVISNSLTYKVWTAVMGQARIDNPAVLITQQPAIGSMFKSQNGSTWTPEQTQDLCFNLNRAAFSIDKIGQVALVDSAINGYVVLPPNPFKLTVGQIIVKVHQNNHGLAAGMLVSYFNSIETQFNNKNFTVSYIIDSDYYTITTTSAQTITNYVGGGNVITERVTKFGSISIPNFAIGASVGTQVSFTASTVGAVDTIPTPLKSGELINLEINKYVQSSINEVNQLKGANSFTLNTSLSSLDNAVSPVIDMNNIAVSLMSNRINYPSPSNVNYLIDGTIILTGTSNITFYANNTIGVPVTTNYTQIVLGAWIRITDVGGANDGATGYISAIDTTNNLISLVGTTLVGANNRSAVISQYLSYIDESQNGGSADSKYITVPVELPVMNTGFRVMVSLNVPVNTDITMYYRTGLQSDAIKLANTTWTNSLITYKYSIGESDFIDYEYDIRDLASYDEFQFKFVFLSVSSSSPKIRNLRIISHA